jgi:hypothetical protein
LDHINYYDALTPSEILIILDYIFQKHDEIKIFSNNPIVHNIISQNVTFNNALSSNTLEIPKTAIFLDYDFHFNEFQSRYLTQFERNILELDKIANYQMQYALLSDVIYFINYQTLKNSNWFNCLKSFAQITQQNNKLIPIEICKLHDDISPTYIKKPISFRLKDFEIEFTTSMLSRCYKDSKKFYLNDLLNLHEFKTNFYYKIAYKVVFYYIETLDLTLCIDMIFDSTIDEDKYKNKIQKFQLCSMIKNFSVFYNVRLKESLLLKNNIVLKVDPWSYKAYLHHIEENEEEIIILNYSFIELPTKKSINEFKEIDLLLKALAYYAHFNYKIFNKKLKVGYYRCHSDFMKTNLYLLEICERDIETIKFILNELYEQTITI